MCQLQTDQFLPYFNLLNLFAYGNYRQYLQARDSLPELTPTQQQKLRHLTIVTLSETNKVGSLFFIQSSKQIIYRFAALQCIPYQVLVHELDMKNLRELEDLVIEAIYGGNKL